MPDRIIAHLDMDAFYAAIEERDNPQFSGMPIVVGADPKKGGGRGVVSTANYAARKFGIKSAMPISQAYQLAPSAIFLLPDIEKYRRVSQEILEIISSAVPVVEQASTDEFYLDLSHFKSYEKATQLVVELKKEIRERENLTCSVGIGPNKLIAKIASSKMKPNGLFVVKPAEVYDFLAPLDIQEIPGIGPKTAQRFRSQKIETIEELRNLDQRELRKLVGVFGDTLFDLVQGKDERPIGEMQPVKSVGKQVTFEKDTADPKLITETLLKLTKEVWEEMTNISLSSKTVTITIRYKNFETHTKAETPKREITEFSQFRKTVLKLLLPFLNQRKKVRLVGVRLSIGKTASPVLK